MSYFVNTKKCHCRWEIFAFLYTWKSESRLPPRTCEMNFFLGVHGKISFWIVIRSTTVYVYGLISTNAIWWLRMETRILFYASSCYSTWKIFIPYICAIWIFTKTRICSIINVRQRSVPSRLFNSTSTTVIASSRNINLMISTREFGHGCAFVFARFQRLFTAPSSFSRL